MIDGRIMIDRLQTGPAPTPRMSFDDGRGLLPDRISTSAPIGMRADIRRAATMTGSTSASFIRDAIAERIKVVMKDERQHV